MSESQFIFEATAENFQQGVIDNSYKAPVVVDFWAEWCEPCKQLMPILHKIVDEMQGQCVLAKVNSETERELAQQFQIRSIPTVMIFKNGEVVEKFSGVLPEQSIRNRIEQHRITEADIKRQQALQAMQSNDIDSAKALLLQAEQLDAEHVGIQIDLAHLEAKQQDYTAAQTRLNKLKIADREREEVINLLNKIELEMATQNAPPLEELSRMVEQNPADNLSRYQLATLLINQGEHETGLQHLLTILQRDRKFQNDGARKAMLSTFSLLGNEHPLVNEYRRKMFNAMH
ncbi:MAG TPA: thioredoxin [Gammaproteobacteria bacterium]